MNAAPDYNPEDQSLPANQFDLIAVGGASADTFLNLVENDPKWRLNLKTKELCFRYGEKITVESSEVHMGGNAQNVSVGLSRLGYKVALMVELGDDFYADQVLKNLTQEKVNTQLILQTPGKPTSSSVIMNLKGDRTLFSQHAAHEHEFDFNASIATRLLYLTSLGGIWDKAYQVVLDFALANQVPIAFNPGTRQLSEKGEVFWNVLKHAHILFLNLEEAKSVLKSAQPKKNYDKMPVQTLMEEMASLGPKIVVITDGKNGSYARAEDGRCFEQGLVPATVVERTGAGDSFATGVIGAALAGKSLQVAMYWGAKNAASVVGRVGAQPGLLDRQQIETEGDPLLVSLGCDEPLIVLPFDHRTSLAKQCFNLPVDALNAEQSAHLSDDKMVVYEAFKEAIALGLPQPDAAIMVDEQFGHEIINLANRENMAVILPVEKSGKQPFEFTYPDDFQSHIEKYKPTFVKGLVFYNPADTLAVRKAQQEKLKQLSDYCHQHGYKLLLEIITRPNKAQLEKVQDSQEMFKKTTLPGLQFKIVQDFHQAGIEPDVWMFGHFTDPTVYRKLIGEIRKDGRDNVGIIISDYDANSQQIAEAITTCATIPGVIGYAAGSAVFWDAISDYHKRDATRLQAKNRIASEFMRLYQIYKQTKSAGLAPNTTQPEDAISDEVSPDQSWATEAAQSSQALEDVTNLGGADQAAAEGHVEPQNDSQRYEPQLEAEPQPRKGIFGKLFKR